MEITPQHQNYKYRYIKTRKLSTCRHKETSRHTIGVCVYIFIYTMVHKNNQHEQKTLKKQNKSDKKRKTTKTSQSMTTDVSR